MTNPTVEKEIREQLDRLPIEQQRQVLEFARALVAARTRGVPGQDLLRFAGTIDGNDLVTISNAVEAGCETVNHDEW